jgi:hypothetical protein
VAWSKASGEAVRDGVSRAIELQVKINAVTAASKIIVDENDDFNIQNAAQVTAYINLLTTRRDNILAAVKPEVAGW